MSLRRGHAVQYYNTLLYNPRVMVFLEPVKLSPRGAWCTVAGEGVVVYHVLQQYRTVGIDLVPKIAEIRSPGGAIDGGVVCRMPYITHGSHVICTVFHACRSPSLAYKSSL